MKLLIFVVAILCIGMDSESESGSKIFINSRTDVFIDGNGEFFDSESMHQTFLISFDDSVFVRKIPATKEEIRGKIMFMGQAKDKLIDEVVTQFRVMNFHTQENEFYILWQRESGSFSLFQEIPETNNRIFFDPNVRCIH